MAHGVDRFYRAMLAQSAVMRLLSSVRPSVCLSVTFRYQEHIQHIRYAGTAVLLRLQRV